MKGRRGEYLRPDWTGRKRPGPSSSARASVRRSYRNRCVICGSRAWKVDHIFPFFFGGTNHPHNLVLLCASCNERKGALLNGPEMHRLAGMGYAEARKALRVAEWARMGEDWIRENLPPRVAKKVLAVKNKHPWAVVELVP